MLPLTRKQIFMAVLLVGIGVLTLVFTHVGIERVFGKDLANYAQEIVETCKDSAYKPSCYDEEIPKVMDEISMEDAFQVTRLVQEKDDSYFYCHVLGHNLSAREAAKDPARWTEVIARCPLGMCSNGCLHGTFQERFRDAEKLEEGQIYAILPQLQSICEDSEDRVFTGLERASCFHALGHLTMYVTGADSNRSTRLCDEITAGGREGLRRVCYDGVYMQIYQPLEPEDFALVQDFAPKSQQEAIAFCNQYEGEKRASCHGETWPLFENEIKTAEGIIEFCSRAGTKKQQQVCYNGVFYVNAPQLDFDVDAIGALCEELPDDVRAQCYGNSASRMIETDYRLQEKAVALCDQAEAVGVGEACWREMLLYSTYNFIPDSEEFNAFCALLPGDLEDRCLAKEGYSITLYEE